MHFLNCLHPVRIERMGEVKFVPCGKCDYCRFVRNNSMSNRLQLESQQYSYSFFGTLTYADMFVPKMQYDSDCNLLYVDDSNLLRGEDGLCVSLPPLTEVEKDLLKKSPCVFYLSRLDAQRFMKRLRIYIKRKIFNPLLNDGKVKEEEEVEFRITYALCGEYGPTRYRPHFHFLLFFNRVEIARKIAEAIRTCWPYGSAYCRFSSNVGKDSDYCTQYLGSLYRLPYYLQRREIRPFLLVSKNHSIGLPPLSEEAVQKLFARRSPTFCFHDARVGKDVELPLWKSLEDKLYPRFSQYGCLDDRSRIGLLRYALRPFSCYQEFYREFCKIVCENWDYTLCDYHGVSPYILKDYYNLFVKNTNCQSEFFKFYGQNYAPPINLGYKKSPFDSALLSLWYCAKRIRKNMHVFCVDSVDDYVSIINDYLYNKEQYRLKLQYEFQNEWFQNHPDWLVFLDLGSNSVEDVLSCGEMNDVISHVEAVKKHSHKNRRKYAYLAHHPEYSIYSQYDETLGFN